MSEYIKREDAIDAVNTYKGQRFGEDRDMHIKRVLSELPAADVVEVVRCKDCEHHEELLYNNDGKVLCWVHGLDVVVDGNGYCSYGERKEQEHEQGDKSDL